MSVDWEELMEIRGFVDIADAFGWYNQPHFYILVADAPTAGGWYYQFDGGIFSVAPVERSGGPYASRHEACRALISALRGRQREGG